MVINSNGGGDWEERGEVYDSDDSYRKYMNPYIQSTRNEDTV